MCGTIQIMPEVEQHVRALLTDEFGSPQMAVDGSVTPVRFSWPLSGHGRVHLHLLQFSLQLRRQPRVEYFGSEPALTNGLRIGFYNQHHELIFAGTVSFKSNYEFIMTGAQFCILPFQRNRALRIVYREPEGVMLEPGDYVAVDVRDDLTKLRNFHAYVVGMHGTH